MRQKFLIQNGSESLVVFFAGWGTGPKLVEGLVMPCDFMCVWDYSSHDFDFQSITGYKNVYVVAWSFGVVAATYVMQQERLPIVLTLAICGTQYPVDNERGIPEAIFDATRNSLSISSLNKFYRRLCVDREHFAQLQSRLDEPNIESLENQLGMVAGMPIEPMAWDKVIVARHDRIFPLENCLNGWAGLCGQLIIADDEAHYPTDLGSIFAANIIDKSLVKSRFAKSFENQYNSEAKAQKDIARKLISLWLGHCQPQERAEVLEVGCGSGMFTREYLEIFSPKRLVLNDLCQEPQIMLNMVETSYEFLQGDAEQLDFKPASFNYVVSTSAMQWFENLPRFLGNAARWLRPEGMLIASTFGSANCRELSDLTGISLHYKDETWLKRTLSDDFETVETESELIRLEFDSPLEVFRHIRKTGVNGLGSNRMSSQRLKKVMDSYPRNERGKCVLTYNPIYIIAKKKQ